MSAKKKKLQQPNEAQFRRCQSPEALGEESVVAAVLGEEKSLGVVALRLERVGRSLATTMVQLLGREKETEGVTTAAKLRPFLAAIS